MVNARKLGVAGGILWGVVLFLTTITSIYTGYAHMFLELFEGIYPWYSISWPGAFSGLICGFIDAFIGLWILGWLYNKL